MPASSSGCIATAKSYRCRWTRSNVWKPCLLRHAPAPDPDPESKLTDPEGVINNDTPSPLPFEPFVQTLEKGYSAAANAAVVWTQCLEIGGQYNNGNANTSLINVAGVLERNTKSHMRQIDVSGQWGENNGQQTVNRWMANSNFDWPVHDKWIAFMTSKNEYNEPANLDYRGTLSAGGGYRFVYEDKRRMIVRFGPAYTLEVYISPSNIRHTPDMFGELEMKWPVFERTVIEQKMRVQPSLLNAELVRVFSTTGLMVDLDEKDRWKLRFGLNYQYISIPNPGRVPTDYTTTVSLVYQRK